MKEFFGFGGYTRPVEGFLSWQHLTFVTILVAIMIFLGIVLGKKNRLADMNQKNRVLIWAALVMDGLELFKIVLFCFRTEDPMNWLYNLPLFLCSIQLIALPMAAFCKGRLKEAALDFVFIFGMLGALSGTYGAGNDYSSYPVLCFDNVVSGLTHTIAGFSALYIGVSGMASMEKRNVGITFAILFGFCVAAHTANILLDYNYMFLMRGDDTPYEILFSLTGGNPLWYPLCVVVMFLVYILAFYGIYFKATHRKVKQSVA